MTISADSVRVCCRVRPLVAKEKRENATECIVFAPGGDKNQITIGKDRHFTFDYVFGSNCQQSEIFDNAVIPLTDSLFDGYNSCILAYGQTGSGKTFTMGTADNSNVDEENLGILPRAIKYIFDTANSRLSNGLASDIQISVSFIELYNEDINDLLDQNDVSNNNKILAIREDPNGTVCIPGVKEQVVESYEHTLETLERGTLCRTTGATMMNAVSSRSHAIFTITVEQKRNRTIDSDVSIPEVVIGKFNFVDLAGSERAKKTGAEGARLKEGISINQGLLALGNVISALGDEKKRSVISHVPYRDSKLTRILKDSLGGNSRTLMVACVSPADSNFQESLNTLKYANRARNIQNKPTVNIASDTAEMMALRSRIAQLEEEVKLSGDGIKLRIVEAENSRLIKMLEAERDRYKVVVSEKIRLQAERDRAIILLQNNNLSVDGIVIQNNEDVNDCNDAPVDIIEGYIRKISELEQMLRIRDADIEVLENDLTKIPRVYNSIQRRSRLSEISIDISSLSEEEMSQLQNFNPTEFELEKAEIEKIAFEIDSKEEMVLALMKNSEKLHSMRLQYEFRLKELEDIAKEKVIERDRTVALLSDLEKKAKTDAAADSSDAKAEREAHRNRLKDLETQLKELRMKQREQERLLRSSKENERQLITAKEDLQKLKYQKINLQKKISDSEKTFVLYKKQTTAEIATLQRAEKKAVKEIQELRTGADRKDLLLERRKDIIESKEKKLKDLQAQLAGMARAKIRNIKSGKSNIGHIEKYQNGGSVMPSPSPQKDWLNKELDRATKVIEAEEILEKEKAQREALLRKREKYESKKNSLMAPSSVVVINRSVASPSSPINSPGSPMLTRQTPTKSMSDLISDYNARIESLNAEIEYKDMKIKSVSDMAKKFNLSEDLLNGTDLLPIDTKEDAMDIVQAFFANLVELKDKESHAEKKITELEDKVVAQRNEIAKVNELLSSKSLEIRERYEQEIQEYKKQIETISTTLNDDREEISRLEAELEEEKSKNNRHSNEIMEVEKNKFSQMLSKEKLEREVDILALDLQLQNRYISTIKDLEKKNKFLQTKVSMLSGGSKGSKRALVDASDENSGYGVNVGKVADENKGDTGVAGATVAATGTRRKTRRS